jgi:hypothetical protein
VRHRRGVRPPMTAVTMRVKPNDPLQKILMGRQTVGQDKFTVCVCRDEEQLSCVTTLVQDPEVHGYYLRSWMKLYELLGVSEFHQRELVLLSIMLEQPSFQPLDMLVGHPDNPCLLAEVWKSKGLCIGPINIAGNYSKVALGNAYATQEGW